MVVEGLTTAPVLRDLAHRLEIELPITEGVCAVLEGKSLTDLVRVELALGLLGACAVVSISALLAKKVDGIMLPHKIETSLDGEPNEAGAQATADAVGGFSMQLDVRDPEDVIGERVLLLLLLIAIAYAAVFLLLPFVAVRKTWSKLPSKGLSGIYFAALGLGFMLFEITMIQRLVLFLGYPTYSLTVTLASILVFTGIGALLSKRLIYRAGWAMPRILAALAVLTLFYQFGLGPLTDSMLSAGLGVRVFMAVVVLAPLGLCLGMFMPLGLGLVSRITDHGEEYAAWSWAVNGFFSVIGSVLQPRT
jgi:hypothetical protein